VQFIQYIIVACGAFLASIAGACFAQRITDRMHLARSFSAGTVFAVAFFVFLPQSILRSHAVHDADELLPMVGLGFVIALLLERFGSLGMLCAERHRAARKHYWHAILNGAGIGIAGHVSSGLSLVVAAALLVNEFSDSADTMSAALRGGFRGGVLREGVVSSLCMGAGLGVTYIPEETPNALSIALALCGGYFAYLSASELIPETYHEHPQLLTVAMTFGGAGAMYVASAMVAP
jgi:hypothetical protein